MDRAVAESPPALEQRLRALFERHRQTPGEPYDDARFLDYLQACPGKRGSVHNGFRSLARLHRFLRALQLELRVCLSGNDLERDWSVAKLVERVRHKQGNPGAGARLARQRQVEERSAYASSLSAVHAVLLLPAAATAVMAGAWWPVLLAASITAPASVKLVRMRARDLRFLRELAERLEEDAGRARDARLLVGRRRG